MRRLESQGVRSAARVFGTGDCDLKLGNEYPPVPFLVQEFVPGVDLDEYLASRQLRPHVNMRVHHRGNRRSVFSGIKDPKTFLRLAQAVINAVAEVHKHEVVHGDLWPPNIRINSKGEAIIIDFGQSLLVDLFFLFQKVPISHKYAAPERRIPGGEWSTAADIYSLGGLLFFMATGDPPPDPINDREDLKKEICQRMKKANPELYLANSGIADVIARCLRSFHRDRPSSAEGVMEELSIFLTGPEDRSSRLNQAMRSLRTGVGKLAKGPSEIFTHIASARIREITRQFAEMSGGLYTLTGHYEGVIRGMVNCLSLLEKGDSYITVSILSFWSSNPGGLGVNGRFLEMNKIAAQNGVSIGRVFLVTEEEERSDRLREILKAHLRVVQELEQREPSVATNKEIISSKRPGYYAGVRRITQELRDKLDLTNYAIWTKARQNQDVLIVPQYREKDKELAAIRFWAPTVARNRIVAHRQQALKLIELSTPLRSFLSSLNKEERRKDLRHRGDERLELKWSLRNRVRRGGSQSETFSAKIVDYSSSGLCLRLLPPIPQNGLKKGSILKLVETNQVNQMLTKELRGADLNVKWLTEPGAVSCKVGLQRANV